MIVKSRVLVVESDAEFEMPTLQIVGRLMIERRTVCAIYEIAIEQEIVALPLYRIMRICFVSILDNQLIDAVILECHRCHHIQILIESECTDKPFIIAIIVALDNKVLSQRQFFLCLSQCEILQRAKILVKRHVVIKILHRCDA